MPAQLVCQASIDHQRKNMHDPALHVRRIPLNHGCEDIDLDMLVAGSDKRNARKDYDNHQHLDHLGTAKNRLVKTVAPDDINEGQNHHDEQRDASKNCQHPLDAFENLFHRALPFCSVGHGRFALGDAGEVRVYNGLTVNSGLCHLCDPLVGDRLAQLPQTRFQLF